LTDETITLNESLFLLRDYLNFVKEEDFFDFVLSFPSPPTLLKFQQQKKKKTLIDMII
jgi:hypothetical protein